jgi:ribosomal protein L40E
VKGALIMGRPRKSVQPQSFSIDKKLLGFVQQLADKKSATGTKCTMSHIVNMALADYQPIVQLDVYRNYWECTQRDCRELNPPTEEKCKKCGDRALWAIQKEADDRIKYLLERG